MESLVLREIDVGIPQGKLTVVIGEVGSGELPLSSTPPPLVTPQPRSEQPRLQSP